MTQNGKQWLFAFTMGILIPALFFAVAEKIIGYKQPMPSGTEGSEEYAEETEAVYDGYGIVVLLSDGRFEQMDLEQYVTGVVLGELPADFHRETIKAQAVVARTYALKRGGSGKHQKNAVCTSPSCCQAYCSYEAFLQNGGTQQLYEMITADVASTAGEVLMYHETLIDATYFSCSGGRTEDAKSVWGSDIPYLQAQDSPGEENAAHYTDTIKFAAAEFANLLEITLTGSPASWIGDITYTAGGGVDTIVIAGTIFRGTTVRQKLGLRSTAFTIMPVGEYIHIVTRGFGHRVGMSQYGAEAMAVQGSSYQEILQYYYPGTDLKCITQN